MSTITDGQRAAIAAKLNGMTLPRGLGNEHSACSIAAINLALTGELTDNIPDCMSLVIGKWVIGVQDAMPHAVRNSKTWKSLLPEAAGTGREQEQERLAIILDWMWGTVLPTLQPIADEHGFGADWSKMTTERTEVAAWEASRAAAACSAVAVEAVEAASRPARAAAKAAAWAAEAAEAAWAAVGVAKSAAVSLCAAEGVAAAKVAAWEKFDACGMLEKLIEVKS
jgi:hypothetical protein